MKFCAAAVLAIAATSVDAFAPQVSNSRSATMLQSTTEGSAKPRTKKEDRLAFMKSDQFHRRGFKEVREKVNELESAIYDLVEPFEDALRDKDNEIDELEYELEEEVA